MKIFSHSVAPRLREQILRSRMRLNDSKGDLLSLYKRERIKVRDFLRSALQAPTRLPGERHRDFHALHHSRSAEPGRQFAPKSPLALGLAVCATRRHGRNRPARPPVELPGNGSRGYSDRSDAVAGIYAEGPGCAGVARGCAQTGSHCGGDSERFSSLGGLEEFSAFGEALLLPPHLNRLPRSGGEEEDFDLQSFSRSSAGSRFRGPGRDREKKK
jgi:hypothetical protein